jgi:hypothetical protein
MYKRPYFSLLFLGLATAVMVRGIMTGNVSLWLCNLVPWFIFYGFFTGNIQLVKGAISLGFIPHTIFIIGTILHFVFGIPVPGVMLEVFMFSSLDTALAIGIHVLSAVALVSTFKIETKSISMGYATGMALIVYLLVLLFTEPTQNVNFIYSFGLKIPLYTVLWPIFAFTFLVIPTYLIQASLHRWNIMRILAQARQGNCRVHLLPFQDLRVCLLP